MISLDTVLLTSLFAQFSKEKCKSALLWRRISFVLFLIGGLLGSRSMSTLIYCNLSLDYKTNATDIATQSANRTYLQDIKIVSKFYRLMLCSKSFLMVNSSSKKLFLNCTFRNKAYLLLMQLAVWSRKRTCSCGLATVHAN